MICYCQTLSQQLEGSHALFGTQMADFLAALTGRGPVVERGGAAYSYFSSISQFG